MTPQNIWLLLFFIWHDSFGDEHIVPSSWRGFNRYCWAMFGTGRTERDEPRPYLRRHVPKRAWPEFLRDCWKQYGTGRTEPDK